MKSKVFRRLAASILAAAVIGTTAFSGTGVAYASTVSESTTEKTQSNASASVTADKSTAKEYGNIKLNVKAENKDSNDKTLRLYFFVQAFADDENFDLPEDKEDWNQFLTVPSTTIDVKGLDKKNSLTVESVSNGLFKKTSENKMTLKTDSADGVYSKRYLEVKLPANSSMDFDLTTFCDYVDHVYVVSAISDGDTESYCDRTALSWTEDKNAKDDANKTYRLRAEDVKGWKFTVNGETETEAKEGDRIDLDCVEQGEGVFSEFYALTQDDEKLDIQYDEDKDSYYFIMPAMSTVVRASIVSEESAIETTSRTPGVGTSHQLTYYDHRMNGDQESNSSLGRPKLQVGFFGIDGGVIAMCLNHTKQPPHPGDANHVGDMTSDNYWLTATYCYTDNSTDQSKNIRKVFYYGYNGPGQVTGTDTYGFWQTTLAASVIFSGEDDSLGIGKAWLSEVVYKQADIPGGNGFNVTSLKSDTQSDKQQLGFWTMYRSTYSYGQGYPKSLGFTYSGKDAILPSLDIHLVKTDVDTGAVLEGASFDVYMDGNKVSTITTDANGKASYHWTGNAIWTESASSYKSVAGNNFSAWNSSFYTAQRDVVSDVNRKLTTLKANTTHKWKVVETVAPKGYKINPNVWEQTLSANTTAVEISFADEPDGYITLKKTSGNESITKDNSCYDLSGAVYGVYETENDAKNDTNRKATLTTDSDGNTNVEVCGTGTRYVKELTAAKGYLLCDGTHDNATGGIHKIEVTTDNNDKNPAVVNCTEPVGNDPFVLQLHKMDYDTGEASAVGDAGLQGAIFELDYYTNTDGKTTGTPTRKWYFKTNEKGILFCSNESYLVSNYTMNNGTVLKSDSLFKDTDTGNVIYPIGSYRIKEVVPPLDYQNVGTMNYVEDKTGRTDVTTGLVAIIKQDSNGENPHIYDGNKKIQGNITASNLAINIYDKVYKGSISVVKKDANDNTTPIAGAKYKLVGQTDGKTYTGTTDANGKVSWSNLIPQNYTLTELSTPDGYSLLKDNVNVKIPMELTLDEINKSGADIKKSVFDETSQMYCFYDLSYTIGESVTPPFPSTGADQHLLFLLLIGALAVTGTGVILFMKKSKKHDDDDLPRGICSK